MDKKDNLLRYYEAEMRYLKEAAGDFARAHPESARYLNLEQSLERDPMVERLFEGFAFLNARLYQKIDDDMPELTERVLGLLWPHYLQAIPSMSVAQLRLNEEINTHFQSIGPGLVLQTAIDPQSGLRCEYRTTEAVDIYPLQLAMARLAHNNLGQSVIQLQLNLCHAQAGQQVLLPARFALKVFVTGEMETRLSLYHYLLNYLDGITTDGDFTRRSGRITLKRCHFDAQRVMWLQGQGRAVTEHDLMMEYFLFREKFLFFEIDGLCAADFENAGHCVLLNCHLKQDFPLQLGFNQDYFQLFCTPVINLCSLEAEPVMRTPLNTEYPLRPVQQAEGQLQIVGVQKVESYSQYDGQRRQYVAFDAFRHDQAELNVDALRQSYYYVHNRAGAGREYDTCITFAGAEELADDEVVSITVWACHGDLPRRISKFNKNLYLLSPVLGIAGAQMVMVPTPVFYPPDFKNQHWQWLFEMGHNYLATLNCNVLQNSLRMLNWSASARNAQFIAAIQSVQHRIEHRLHKGMMIRCLVIEVELDAAAFINEADAALFAFALNEFLLGFAQLNLAVEVHVQLQPDGRSFVWPLRISEVIG